MFPLLEPTMDFVSLGLLLLRIGFAGTIMLYHGLPKLLDFSHKMHSFPDPIGLGSGIGLSLIVFAEFLCSTLVVIGVFTRFTVVPLIIAMSVAFFVVHGNDPMAKKELALLYLVAFTAILAAGPGRFSADSLLRGTR
jgi:putative oxidoreductase